VSFTNGRFLPSPPPAALDELTDKLIMVAAEVINNVSNGLTGNARLRLIGWVVADARGAQIVMEPALALLVGKRLDRQAQQVREACWRAASDAEAQRKAARDAAAANLSLLNGLPAQLLSINLKERQALAAPSREVYVGFHELGGLLGGDDFAPAAAVPPAPLVLPAPPTPPTRAAAARAAPAATDASHEALQLVRELRAAQADFEQTRKRKLQEPKPHAVPD